MVSCLATSAGEHFPGGDADLGYGGTGTSTGVIFVGEGSIGGKIKGCAGYLIHPSDFR